MNASPAELLEELLVPKLALEPGDKDMLVMYHKFKYRLDGVKYQIESSMVNLGEDQIFTSMSNTVGLPVGIAAKMILTGNLKEKGVTLPIKAEVYEPILNELKAYGIEFTESEKVIKLI
jgi:saccharopine dehydrogenase-like NADP-dependent oxidoreductase